MTSKESLFNTAVYKNTLHRFKWGSLLYFIILFFSGPFLYITKSPSEIAAQYYNYSELKFSYANSRILSNNVLSVSILIAFGVSTVVALLVYNFVHSARHGIFAHSLPVSRKANYISTVCAAFTLMALPVVLNGVVFMLMSVCGYENVLGVVPALIWILLNLFTLFVMFSISSFSAFLTGNSFAMVAINILLHTLPLILFLMLNLIGEHFLYGYSDSSSIDIIQNLSPAMWLYSTLSRGGEAAMKLFCQLHTWILAAFSVLLYLLTLLLYKKRKIELCGDVAGFCIMKPILKYTVTLFACIFAFSVFEGAQINTIVLFAAVALICAVVYFACEMLLRKSVRVIDAYKGYAAFIVCCGAIITFCAFTHVFGFETYLPDAANVKQIALYNNYNYAPPYVSAPDAVKDAISFQRQILKSIPVTNPVFNSQENDCDVLTFVYKLNNGKSVTRRYEVAKSFSDEAIGKMFENKDYKNILSGLSQLNIENIDNINPVANYGCFSYTLALNNDSQGLFRAIQKDIDTMNYTQFSAYYSCTFSVDISLTARENKNDKIFKRTQEGSDDFWFSLEITPEYKNTIAFLKDKGYYDIAVNMITDNMYMVNQPFTRKDNAYSFDGNTMKNDDFLLSKYNFTRLEKADAENIFNLSQSAPDTCNTLPDGRYYYVFCFDTENSSYYSSNRCYCFEAGKVPKNIKKYLK